MISDLSLFPPRTASLAVPRLGARLLAVLAVLLTLAGPAPALAQSEEGDDAAPTETLDAEGGTDTFEMLDLFGQVFEQVRREYVEDVSDKKLIEAAIQGMLRSLDPHSVYLNEESFDAMRTNTRGEFGGLGIEVTMDETGYVRVVSPIDDTPAYRAGIEAGDLITHLDGEAVQGLTLNDAVDQMRGPVGSDITLTIVRDGGDPFDVTITRDNIQIQSVRSRVEGDAGYIRITSFSGQTQNGLDRAIDEIKAELGDDLQGYVIDLRNNPGGLLDQAISISDTFLDKGEIVSTRGREAESIQRFQATAGDRANGLPLVVLINGGSASASEIVAGALQDHGRAIVLGTQSFGKGSVQTIMPLNRRGSAIKLTTQRYYTPSGRSIQAKGISPDILVERAKLEVLESGDQRTEADLRNALTNEEDENAAPEPPETGEGTDEAPAPDSESGDENVEAEAHDRAIDDYQLARALDLIKGIALYRRQAAE
ncbi:S41 family peptidase [Marivibrio halodurans]|uniref:S41 family peptidase n=1 Tax=Marivibrio halodurans TaxID=2039722 RepID=A0A8J7S286_9PROT|nr:S41 family peptidase [Marivibrio halodurans]MBP5859007.1 S41 family peptidase [Marivibrio halodurans]